jgi:hypothetical protein
LAGTSVLPLLCPRDICKPPFAILGGVTTWVTGPFIVTLFTALPPGLTLLEFPKECLDVLRVDTFKAWEWFNLWERFILRFNCGWCWGRRAGPPRRRPPWGPGDDRSVTMTIPSGCVLAAGCVPPFITAVEDGATVVSMCFNMAVTTRRRPYVTTSDKPGDIWWRHMTSSTQGLLIPRYYAGENKTRHHWKKNTSSRHFCATAVIFVVDQGLMCCCTCRPASLSLL